MGGADAQDSGRSGDHDGAVGTEDAPTDAGIDSSGDALPNRDGGVIDGSELDSGVDAGDDSGPSPDGGAMPDSGGGPDSGTIADLSDEFNDSSTLSNWSILNIVQGTPPHYSILDINTSTAGKFTVVPTGNFWFDDEHATFVYKMVTGDFVMHTLVSAHNINSTTEPPHSQYNGGGLMVRDPASQMSMENWVIMTTGYQDQYVGTEDASTAMSVTSLNLRPDSFELELIICRLGDTLHLFSRPLDRVTWQDVDDDVRPDLPSTIQVGIAAQSFEPPHDVRVEFDYVRFAVPTDLMSCTADIPPH
jgi:hypothetical protein